MVGYLWGQLIMLAIPEDEVAGINWNFYLHWFIPLAVAFGKWYDVASDVFCFNQFVNIKKIEPEDSYIIYINSKHQRNSLNNSRDKIPEKQQRTDCFCLEGRQCRSTFRRRRSY